MAAGRKKQKTRFVCRECGHNELREMGKCLSCGAWGSFDEELEPDRKAGGLAGKAAGRSASSGPAVSLADVAGPAGADRLLTGSAEFDRALGGGFVPGATILLGGDPGIGKSTLALQAAAAIARRGATVLYVAGEEAPAQVRLRAERTGACEAGIFVLDSTAVEAVEREIADRRPAMVVVDSIQTVSTAALESAPGSVSQLRETSARLAEAARSVGSALVLIGHVTKEGMIAGPRVLEHMVDAVVYFEGDGQHAFRIVRAVKNRFGPAHEIGVFEMEASGLRDITDPSEVLAAGRAGNAPGSAVTTALQGSRPVLVEVQALVAAANPGTARRTTLGIDAARVAMLAAVLEKRVGLSLVQQDVFVNTAGGLRLVDPGVDLAVTAALASSYVDRPLPEATAVIGEVGLTGEVRPVSQLAARMREAARLGLKRAVFPSASGRLEKVRGLETIPVATVAEAWEVLRS